MANINFEFELAPTEALALAQYVKRVSWTDVRRNAVDDNEAYRIMDAINVLQKAMAEEGYAPR